MQSKTYSRGVESKLRTTGVAAGLCFVPAPKRPRKSTNHDLQSKND
uniref:Uncharacterized protein n=1 Tax=Anguilla anguilla TaxID=7936 RepID=A0A0E9VME5_ANGAN